MQKFVYAFSMIYKFHYFTSYLHMCFFLLKEKKKFVEIFHHIDLLREKFSMAFCVRKCLMYYFMAYSYKGEFFSNIWFILLQVQERWWWQSMVLWKIKAFYLNKLKFSYNQLLDVLFAFIVFCSRCLANAAFKYLPIYPSHNMANCLWTNLKNSQYKYNKCCSK